MTERIYLPWIHSFEPGFAWIDHPMPESIRPVCHKLMFGESAAKDLAETEPVFDLSPEHGEVLTDSIPNTWNIVVVSDRLRQVLVQTGEPIEFYPVRLRNPKGLELDARYHVMNPISLIECMDADRSDFDDDPVEPGQVHRFRRLVLDVEKIPADRKIFRLARQKELVLVRRDLAYEIFRVHEYRGMIFLALEHFGKDFR